MIPTYTLQRVLADLGHYQGRIDGLHGPKTKRAFNNALNATGLNGLPVDMVVALVQHYLHCRGHNPGPIDGVKGVRTEVALQAWYRRNILNGELPYEAEVPTWYGERGQNQKLIELAYPMRLAWDLKRSVTRIQCHAYVAQQMESIFRETKKHYGLSRVQSLGLDLFGGCLNVRRKRGGSSWSMHSWGIAVDIDPLRNQLRWGADKARLARPEYEGFWSIVESRGAVSYGHERNRDWQHFQFARWP